MMNRAPFMLKEGTVLDDRYVVGDVIGMGGFGIVYRCASLMTGETACVKEFFCRDYMNRDVSASDEVRLNSEEDRGRFEHEKDRFLKEGRILGDFAQEEAIVHIYSQFDANGTSCIAMEYLEGRTLKEAVSEDGPFSEEDIFRKCVPLLKTLSRIHAAGIIHRDISPDNIMMLPDGTLKLMDFGAAGVIESTERTRSLIYKESYSPMEQLGKKNGRQGPWTDLFALSGTLYFCVTGNAPEDAFQRALYDDLKKPSEISGVKESKDGASGKERKSKGAGATGNRGVSAEADRIIMKGLSLAPSGRWTSADEMLAEIQKVWPVLTPQELAKKKKRRRRALVLCVAAAVFAALALSWYMYRNSTRIRFRQITTQQIFLYWDEDAYGEEKFESVISAIRGRVEAWVGPRNYLLEKEEGGYLLTVPADSFGTRTPTIVLRGVITRKLNASLVYDAWTENEREFAAPRDAFEEIRKTDSGLELVMTDELAKEMGTLAAEEGNELLLAMDKAETDNYQYWEVTTEGDGKTLRLDMDEDIVFRDVLYYDLTTEPLAERITFSPETLAEWETTENSLVAGDNQVDHSELAGECIRLLYSDYLDSDITEERSSYLSTMAAMKIRLDSLGVPYAFGLEYYEHNGFVVELPEGAAYEMVCETLGKTALLYLGTYWGTGDSVSGLLIKEEEQGFSLTINFTSQYDMDDAEEAIEKAEETEDRRLYLYHDYKKTAWTYAEEAKKELEEDQSISFTHWNLEGLDEMTDDTIPLADYIVSTKAESPQNSLTWESYTGPYDEDGVLHPSPDLELPGGYTDYASREEIQEFRNIFADRIAVGEASVRTQEGSSGTEISVTFYESEPLDVKASLDEVKALYQKTEARDGRFSVIRFYVTAEDENLGLSFEKNYKAGAMQLFYISGTPEFEEAVNDILETDAFYRELTAVSKPGFSRSAY